MRNDQKFSPPRPLRVFISYSHEDEELRNELTKHLTALEREGLIVTWCDRQLVPGDDWAGIIDENLNTANLILLLVSPSFITSPYCYDIEMQRALARAYREEARVIPIILRPSIWQALPFGKFQALPQDAKPVTDWLNLDQAFLDIARGIQSAAIQILEHREEKAMAEGDDDRLFIIQQISRLKIELETEEDPRRKAFFDKNVERLRQFYRSKHGGDLPSNEK